MDNSIYITDLTDNRLDGQRVCTFKDMLTTANRCADSSDDSFKASVDFYGINSETGLGIIRLDIATPFKIKTHRVKSAIIGLIVRSSEFGIVNGSSRNHISLSFVLDRLLACDNECIRNRPSSSNDSDYGDEAIQYLKVKKALNHIVEGDKNFINGKVSLSKGPNAVILALLIPAMFVADDMKSAFCSALASSDYVEGMSFDDKREYAGVVKEQKGATLTFYVS